MNATFLKFIKYHTPNFYHIKRNGYSFCFQFPCHKCKISSCDQQISLLTLEEYQEIKQKYPEYFI